jgi:hypothetical protein
MLLLLLLLLLLLFLLLLPLLPLLPLLLLLLLQFRALPFCRRGAIASLHSVEQRGEGGGAEGEQQREPLFLHAPAARRTRQQPDARIHKPA